MRPTPDPDRPRSVPDSPVADRALSERARAAGIATSYLDWAGRPVDVDPAAVAAVLAQRGDRPAPTVAPGTPRVPLPLPARCWGWSVQLYALHSAQSWGIGDFADLRVLAVRSAREFGADLVLVNPLHAVAPARPITASPYSPTSRRFVNPLYLRIEDVPEYRDAPAEIRTRIAQLRPAPTGPGALIDRDTVWGAKMAALTLLVPYARGVEPDPELRDFATFCALAEVHGLPWHAWPPELHRPDLPAVAAARTELDARVRFHSWLQLLCDEQLAATQSAARAAGMRIGIVHDLAVGVDPGGADAWALQDLLAGEVTVGAPPDSFNQRGQDWALPPWRPDALAEQDFGPYRAMVAAVLGRGGGIRVDHVMGLSRLWWVPPGAAPDGGTYVSYDQDALLGVLADAARTRNAIVVGEDLGTVEPSMRAALANYGILGSSVLWFERANDEPDGAPKPPEQWREAAMASISTHDLPTAHGLLAGEQVRVRDELGLLTRPVEQERAQADAERSALLSSLVAQGLLDPQDRDDPDAVTLGMHRLLARTPSRVLVASPYDVIGELCQPNLPGTTDEYPNWRIPLPVSIEELLADPRTAATAAALRSG